MKNILGKIAAWFVPFVIAVVAVQAVRNSTRARRKADRAKDEREHTLDNFLNDREADVKGSYEAHRLAQARAKKAKDNAKKRIEKLANTDASLGELLHDYRRDRGLLDGEDDSELGSADSL
jgi:flagellar biosynthesis/type III secretory pathway M-ring protein FliF/YscJ